MSFSDKKLRVAILAVALFLAMEALNVAQFFGKCNSWNGHTDASSPCCSCHQSVNAEPSIPPLEQEAALRSRLSGTALPVSDLRLIMPPVQERCASRSRFRSLPVPEEFDRLHLRDYVPSRDQQQCLQACLRAFTQTMLRGCLMNLLLDSGEDLPTEVTMDADLTHLVLHVSRVQRPVAIAAIERMGAPSQAMAKQGSALAVRHLDEVGCSLMFERGQFLTFIFNTGRARKYFQVCLMAMITISASRTKAMPFHDDSDMSSHDNDVMCVKGV